MEYLSLCSGADIEIMEYWLDEKCLRCYNKSLYDPIFFYTRHLTLDLFFAFAELICHDVPHPRPAAEGHPWQTVDRKVSASPSGHLADETQHAEAPGARGGERVLDQPSVHDSGAGARPCGRASGTELAQDQREQVCQVPRAQICDRSPESPKNHKELVKLEWREEQHSKTLFMRPYDVCPRKLLLVTCHITMIALCSLSCWRKWLPTGYKFCRYMTCSSVVCEENCSSYVNCLGRRKWNYII